MNKKYIICDCARANWGKTTTLNEVINLLLTDKRFSIICGPFGKKDKWIVLKDNNTLKSILIQTEGDSAGSFKRTIDYLEKEAIVDIIICACHHKGSSRTQVVHIANTYNYKQIFFNNFSPIDHIWEPQIENANKNDISNAIINLMKALL